MNKLYVILGGVVVVVAAVLFFVFGGGGMLSDGEPATKHRVIEEKKGKKVAKSAKGKGQDRAESATARKRQRPWRIGGGDVDVFEDSDHSYSKADKQILKDLQEALLNLDEDTDAKPKGRARDRNNVKGKLSSASERSRKRLFDAAAKACRSSDPLVRKSGVEAYSWKGADALPELTPMMADPNQEVAEMAIDAVQDALDEQENPHLRFETAAAYMSTFSANEDALTMLSGTLTAAAQEIIEPDGDGAAAEAKALDNRNLVVEMLSGMIEDGSAKCAEAAREAYSDITSTEWVSREAANMWARDPDGYEQLRLDAQNNPMVPAQAPSAVPQ